VFIQGETGTGKELVARAIAKVQRRDIISVNCGALPADLFEAEFFGTVPGSYTGAVNKAGLIEIAGNGVLFCDEAGKLLLHHQTALLRVTDEKIRRYRRVSEERKQEREANCQFIFATSEPILEEVAARRFNPELANRLTRIMIELPPLRERRVDIRLLTNHFLREGNEVQQKNVELTEEVYRVFENATWPGNVRKLEEFVSNIVESDYNGIVTLDKVRAVIGETKFNQEIGDTGAITIKTAPGCQSMEIAIPLDSSELLTRLRAELYATEPETWMALGQETPEEDAQHENEHESIIIAALKSVLNGRGRELLEDCRKTLKKRDDNNPRRVNVYKVLLYLALHPQHAAALTDFSRVLKLSAWESCRKAADALIENFGSHEPDPVVQRYVEKENRNRKMYQLSDAVL
jgi:DNA-binding NtrC family response regulator